MGRGGGSPLCDIPSGRCFFTGPWTVTRSSLRMLRRVAVFCRPLRYPSPPPGRPAYAPPPSPWRPVPGSMAFVTDSNRPQPLRQPPPTAHLTASGAASEVPSLLMHPCALGRSEGGQHCKDMHPGPAEDLCQLRLLLRWCKGMMRLGSQGNVGKKAWWPPTTPTKRHN